MTESHILQGGRSAGEVLRIGETVHRPQGAHSEFTHALLLLLEEKHYQYAPRFLGIDEQQREIISFIEGTVPHETVAWTETQLVQIMQMLKAFHDATAGTALAGTKEVVCHNDIAPWNTVLKNDTPVAFIDFDDAAPGDRVDDLAYVLWTFLEVGSDKDVTTQAVKMRILCEEYGFLDGHRLLTAILAQQRKILLRREDLAKSASTKEAREFSAWAANNIRSEIAWVTKNKKVLEKAF